MLRRDAAPTYIAGSIWVSVTAANRWFYGRLPIVIMLLPLFLLISNTGEANLRALQRFYLQRTLSTKKEIVYTSTFSTFEEMRKNWSKGQKGPERENYWKDMSGYFLSPSGQKDGLGKKLITTWEGRELVTWLFLKIYHPLSHEKPDKEGKCHIPIKTDKHLHFQNWIFLKIYHIFSQEKLEKKGKRKQ